MFTQLLMNRKAYSNDLVTQFGEKWYKENIFQNQIEKLDNLERSNLLNKTNAERKNVTAFSLTFLFIYLFIFISSLFILGYKKKKKIDIQYRNKKIKPLLKGSSPS